MKKTTWLLPLLLVALVMPAGCIFSPDDDGGDDGGGGGDTTVFPDTRDKLMANFRTAYESMDFFMYRDLLHPEYLTLLQQSTTDAYPDVGTTLDLAEELQIHERMFSGEPLTDPEGTFVPSVASISFQAFERQDEWKTSTEPQIPDGGDAAHPVERALYDVIFLFDRGQTYSTLKVQGQIEFFITSKDSVYNGATRKYYMMRGQKDLTLDQ
jgi:hypothetical protein